MKEILCVLVLRTFVIKKALKFSQGSTFSEF